MPAVTQADQDLILALTSMLKAEREAKPEDLVGLARVRSRWLEENIPEAWRQVALWTEAVRRLNGKGPQAQ